MKKIVFEDDIFNYEVRVYSSNAVCIVRKFKHSFETNFIIIPKEDISKVITFIKENLK